jgi:acyl carrier protein
MDKETFIEVIKNEFYDIDLIQFGDDLNFKQLEEYDSLTGMAIITTLEEEYNIKIIAEEYKKINTIIELYNYVENLK